jgi:succinate dehydrogenase / fumarate reductase membrane anchor subunit
MAEQRIGTSKVAGTWAWFLQRLSAVLLVVLLGVHIYLDHYAQVGAEIDYSMLAMVLFHGLNGTRTILFDFDIFMKRKKTVDIGLLVLGIATMIWGIVILWPFIHG